MRYIYVDEAGTSKKEPVTVVVGIIVQADKAWRSVEREINAALSLVPERHRSGFVFHAKSVWGDPAFREGWSKEDRLALIEHMASIPVRYGLSIALGTVRRDSGGHETIKEYDINVSLEQWHHMLAFSSCLIRADTFLRERTEQEMGTVVVEDIPEMRTKLRQAFKVASLLTMPEHQVTFIPTKRELETGIQTQTHVSGIENIQSSVHFVAKDNDPFLQVADACAFSLRRFFAGEKNGQILIDAMGLPLNFDDWKGASNNALFSTDPILRRQPHRNFGPRS